VLESGIRNTVQDQLKGVVTSSVGVGSKVDGMSGDIRRCAGRWKISRDGWAEQQQLTDRAKPFKLLSDDTNLCASTSGAWRRHENR